MKDGFDKKYENWMVKKLKQTLKILKQQLGDVDEIRYVSHAIRNCITKTKTTNERKTVLDTEKQLRNNFWKTCKTIFRDSIDAIPLFGVDSCFNYFQKMLTQINEYRKYVTPKWIPIIHDASTPFDESPPNL